MSTTAYSQASNQYPVSRAQMQAPPQQMPQTFTQVPQRHPQQQHLQHSHHFQQTFTQPHAPVHLQIQGQGPNLSMQSQQHMPAMSAPQQLIQQQQPHPSVSALRSVYPSGASLRCPDASLCCPDMSWGVSVALRVVTYVYQEVIRKQRKASLTSLWHLYRPWSYPCRVCKSFTFLTFPLPKPHNPQQIHGSFHILNCGH